MHGDRKVRKYVLPLNCVLQRYPLYRVWCCQVCLMGVAYVVPLLCCIDIV
jgi:hypothetical protein